jgi:hypothetical protein
LAASNGNEFPTQTVELGDMVLFYDNPQNPTDPCVGWVSRRPGINTVYILTFSPDTGFVEKPSVRHADDPGLTENAAWRQWGCWRFHPSTEALKRMNTLMPQVVQVLARSSKKGD